MKCRLVFAIAALAVIAGCGGGVGTDGIASSDVAFIKSEGPGTISFWRLDSDFRQTGVYSGPVGPMKVAFSPDGGTVAMMLERNGQYDICTMSTGGGAVHWLTDDPSDDGDPSFSSDGSRIVFCSNRDGHSRIYTMNADGSDQTRLTDTPSGDDTWPAFSRDGTEIVFASTRNSESGCSHIYAMNADGSNVRQITAGDQARDAEPSFSPDGTQIVYVSGSDIYAVKADGTRSIPLAQGWGNCHSPTFSPDGWTIMFSSDRRTLDQQVWMMRTDGGGKSRITEWGGAFPAWIGR